MHRRWSSSAVHNTRCFENDFPLGVYYTFSKVKTATMIAFVQYTEHTSRLIVVVVHNVNRHHADHHVDMIIMHSKDRFLDRERGP